MKTEEINLSVALFSVNTLRYCVTTNDIPAHSLLQLSFRAKTLYLLFFWTGVGGGGGGWARPS